jgi:hypothetical protein
MKPVSHKLARGLIFTILAVAVTTWIGPKSYADETGWPRDIETPKAKIVIYQPQLETLTDDKLTARAAVSVTKQGAAEPVFGAVWFSARILTDRDARTVTTLSVTVSDAKFPDADQSKIEEFSGILESEIPKWDLSISLDQLVTMLALVQKERAAAENLNTDPPKMLFVTHPAMLVSIDGEPSLQKVEDSTLMRVVNTPFFIVLDPSTKTYYLKGGFKWLSAPAVEGPWQAESNLPNSVAKAAVEFEKGSQGGSAQIGDTGMPQIIVVTEPAELVESDGDPEYSPIDGTNLLYMSNTESDVFMEIGSQEYYVLVSGRWFVASSQSGPWSFVASDKLPADFANIPPGSAKAETLPSIAGTQEAKDATAEAYIPQTTAIDRNEATLTVTYDGEPKFEKVEDTTSLYYAVNTSFSVIRVGDASRYYCCNEAVWFEADSPYGPWAVCVSVPPEIYTIPPSCPIYNVKYVYVYDSTPEIVYVGYTPGYTGTYIYGGTIVYGTGYIYRPWYGAIYYPRPVTYGYGVAYNPYGGWRFAAGFAAGAWFGSRHGGWWGGRDIDININRNVYNRGGNRHRNRPGYGGRPGDRRPGDRRPGDRRPGDLGPGDRRPGDRKPGGGGIGDRRPGDRELSSRTPSRGSDRKNNVFADRDGNTFRRGSDGGWSNTDRSKSRATSRTPSSSDRSRTRSLNNQHKARQRGSQRTSSFNSYRSSGGSRAGRSGGGRSGGGRSGGGGRRR